MNEELSNLFEDWINTLPEDERETLCLWDAFLAGAAAGYANGVAVMKERCANIDMKKNSKKD